MFRMCGPMIGNTFLRKRGGTTSLGEPHGLAFNTSFSKSDKTIGRKAENRLEQEPCMAGSAIGRVPDSKTTLNLC